MGNNPPFHEYLYHVLLQHPGIVVLHEYVLHHFLLGIVWETKDWQRYIADMRYSYGPTGERLARLFVQTRQRANPYAFPLFEPAVDASRGVIVHNQYSRQRILKSRPLAQVSAVPMHIIPRQPGGTPENWRARLGLPEQAFIIGSFGFNTPAKRLENKLRAFARFRRSFPRSLYLLVGDVPPTMKNVQPLIHNLGLEQHVILTGYVDMETFLQYMAVTDLALNLRYPIGGETSASLMRLMSLARPVIVPNSGPFTEYPDDCCIKIDMDETEEDALLVMMHVLASDEALRRQIGLNAQQHIQAHHTPEQTAQGYIDFIQHILASESQHFAAVPPLVEPGEDDVLAELVADVGVRLSDLGIGEDDEDILLEIARTINELVPLS
jgi:glycosyltransferase involved in cell wall biosynthesis